MSDFCTSAILLRRVDYAEQDLILTFFTPDLGKISVMAKSAKKSRKRFGGVLEPFSVLNLEVKPGRGNLALLKSASLKRCFPAIRCHLVKCAQAGYWTELVNRFTREAAPDRALFSLFTLALEVLDRDLLPPGAANILFQIRLLKLAGLSPGLTCCGGCHRPLEKMEGASFRFCMAKGSILCSDCPAESKSPIALSPQTARELAWAGSADPKAALRLKFSPKGMQEGTWFLERLMTHHLGGAPKSLSFFHQMLRRKPAAICKKPEDPDDADTCGLSQPGGPYGQAGPCGG